MSFSSIIGVKKWIKFLLLIIGVPVAGIFLFLFALVSSHPGAGSSLKVLVYQWWNNIFKGGDPFMLMETGNRISLEKLLKLHPELAKEREPARGATPLHAAPDVAIAQLLLDHGAEIDATLDDRSDATTPLFEAIYHGRTQVALFLINKGADPKRLDSRNHTPLHIAARCGDVDVTAALLKKGADPQACGPKTDDLTPPQEAAANGKMPVLKFYCEQGIPFNITEALFRTLHRSDIALNQFLLDAGKVDVNAQDKYGETLLHMSAKFGNLEFFKILLERGADPEKLNNKGKSVIDELKANEFYFLDPAKRDQILKILDEHKK